MQFVERSTNNLELARDPSLQSEMTQGFAADPVYVKGEVFAYVGLPHNLKDLTELLVRVGGSRNREGDISPLVIDVPTSMRSPPI